MNGNVLIICESSYRGNTMKLAAAMAFELNCSVVDTLKARSLDINNYTLLGLGSGIFFGKHEPALMEFVNSLGCFKQDCFIFSTHGSPVLSKYHVPLKKILTEKGRNIVGEYSTPGYDCTGPYTIIGGGGNKGKPNERDQTKAQKFVRKLFPQYTVSDPYEYISPRPLGKELPNLYALETKNGQVKLCGDIVSVNHTSCIGCQRCINACPCSVLEIKEGKAMPVREHRCIKCGICRTECPTYSIQLHGSWKDMIRVAFQKG